MPDTPAFLAERLRMEGEKTTAYFTDLTDEQWQTEVYTEGDTWTIRNILAHFVTSERGLLKLFESIRQGGLGASDDFSIDHYNARQQEKTKELTAAELLEQFAEARAETVKWTLDLSQEDLAIEGRHPFMGQVTLVEMLKMIYLHNQLHFRDVRKLIE
jgi:hypothetical protein